MRYKFSILFFLLLYFQVIAQTFSGVGGEIPKNDYNAYDINVTGVGNLSNTYGLEKVCINIQFPKDENLKIALRSPFGTLIYLSQNNGGQGSDYSGTCFTATAQKYIFLGTAPFTGEFLPETSLGLLNNNHSGDGLWSLIIFNSLNVKGLLVDWKLVFSNHPAQLEPEPVVPSCNENLSTVCGNQSICSYDKAYCGSYDRSAGPPYTTTEKRYIRFKAGEKVSKFRLWMKNAGPEYTLTGQPIPIFFKLNIYRGDCLLSSSNLVEQLSLPYNFSKDVTFFNFTIDGLQICQDYTLEMTGTGGQCYFDYIIQQISGLNTKELKIAPENPKICLGDSVKLDVVEGCGPYVWSPSTGLNTTNGSSVIASPIVTTTYTVTSLGVCPKTKQVTVEVLPKVYANAGADQIACSNSFQMNANVPVPPAVGHWEIINGSVLPNTSNDPHQIFILLSSNATLKWVVSNNVCSAEDEVYIENTTPSNVNLSYSYETPVCIKKYHFLSPNTNSLFSFGGVFSSSPGLSINANTGVIDLQNSLPGIYYITYSKTFNTTCGITSFGTSIEIKPFLKPIVEFIYPKNTCKDSGNIFPNLSVGFQSGGIFSCSNSNLSINSVTGEINVAQTIPGTYTVTYSYSGNFAQCLDANTFSQQINITEIPQHLEFYDFSMCDETGTGNSTFDLDRIKKLLTSELNPSITFYETAPDAIIPQNAIANTSGFKNSVPNNQQLIARIDFVDKCTVYSKINLIVTKPPVFDIKIESNTITVNIIEGSAPFEYSLDGINWQDSNVFNNFEKGIIVIYVREKDTNLCVASTKTINMIFIPNTITPNGDGYNDTWDIRGLEYYNEPITIMVFDRNGKKVYDRLYQKNEKWNGSNISKLPSDTYWYIINIPSFGVMKGWLLIKNRE